MYINYKYYYLRDFRDFNLEVVEYLLNNNNKIKKWKVKVKLCIVYLIGF